MFLSLLQFFATKFLVLALHLESGSFPRPSLPGRKPKPFPHCVPVTLPHGKN